MNMRMKSLLGMVALAAIAVCAGQDRPDILFIMSDDHTSQAIGVYGGEVGAVEVSD
jgi:hypothetical protein